MEVGNVRVPHELDIGFETETFADGFDASGQCQLGRYGVVFVEIGLCKATLEAGIRVRFVCDVEALAVAYAWVDAFLDRLLFALDPQGLGLFFDADGAACEVHEDLYGGGVFCVDGGDAGGVIGYEGDEFGVVGAGVGFEDQRGGIAVCWCR